MRHDTITRRRTTCSRRQRSQPWPTTPRLADRIVPGLRVACRGISQGVEHSRLVRGEVLLPLVLALLLILAHRLLPRAVFPKALGQRQSSPTPKPVLSVAERQPVLKRRLQASAQALVLAALNTVVLALFDFLRGRQCPANRCAAWMLTRCRWSSLSWGPCAFLQSLRQKDRNGTGLWCIVAF